MRRSRRRRRRRRRPQGVWGRRRVAMSGEGGVLRGLEYADEKKGG
jgi:hypothetical protein